MIGADAVAIAIAATRPVKSFAALCNSALCRQASNAELVVPIQLSSMGLHQARRPHVRFSPLRTVGNSCRSKEVVFPKTDLRRGSRSKRFVLRYYPAFLSRTAR